MYIVYKEKPQGTIKLPDGSLLMPIQCVEGWFILSKHLEFCNWQGGEKLKKITLIELEETR